MTFWACRRMKGRPCLPSFLCRSFCDVCDAVLEEVSPALKTPSWASVGPGRGRCREFGQAYRLCGEGGIGVGSALDGVYHSCMAARWGKHTAAASIHEWRLDNGQVIKEVDLTLSKSGGTADNAWWAVDVIRGDGWSAL